MSPIQFAMLIRSNVLIMAFPVFVLGTYLMFKRDCFKEPKQLFNTILFIATVTALVKFYPVLTLETTNCVRCSSSQVAKKIDQGMEAWSKTKIAGADETLNITAKITSFFYDASFALSGLIRDFLTFIQRIVLYILIALSPLLVSFFMINETSDIAVKFIMTTIGVILWSIGFNLTDMMLFSGFDIILHHKIISTTSVATLAAYNIGAAVTAGASMTVALPEVVISLALFLAFYFLIGVLVFNVIGIVTVMTLVYGGNPVSAAMGTITAVSTSAGAAMNGVTAVNSLSNKGAGKIASIPQTMSKMAKGLAGFMKGGTNQMPSTAGLTIPFIK